MARHTTNYLLAAACFTPLFFGCNKHTTRADDKQVMVDRYHRVRSGLMHDMALSQLQTGDLEQAASSVAEGLMIDDKHVGLYILAGRIELERSRLERSYNGFEKAIDLLEQPVGIGSQADGVPAGPKDQDAPPRVLNVGEQHQLAEAHYYRAIVLQRWQRPEAALASYQKAFSLRSENPSYMLAAVEAMVELGQAAQGMQLIESNFDRFAQNASVVATLAHLCKMNGQDHRALGLFREASVLDSGNTKVREEYALQLLSVGQIDGGVSVLKSVLREPSYKQRDDLRRRLASAYADLGQIGEARAIYAELIQQSESSVEDWIKAGQLALKDDDLGAALSMANRVVSRADRRPEGYVLAGLVWQHRGRIDRALEMFDEAAACDPRSADALVLRGLALQKAGQPAGAATAYTEALGRDPNDHRAQRLLQQLSVVEP